jgi:hypothetical protein
MISHGRLEMGETTRDSQTNPDGPQGEVESADSRRAYVAPEVTALELETVVKAGVSGNPDGINTRHPQ